MIVNKDDQLIKFIHLYYVFVFTFTLCPDNCRNDPMAPRKGPMFLWKMGKFCFWYL